MQLEVIFLEPKRSERSYEPFACATATFQLPSWKQDVPEFWCASVGNEFLVEKTSLSPSDHIATADDKYFRSLIHDGA